MLSDRQHTIYLISDGTCRTCDQILRATLVQFEEDVHVVRKAGVRRPGTVWEIVERAARDDAIIFYTLVCDDARDAIQAASKQFLVPVVDLLGPVLVGLYDFFQTTKRPKPGVLYKSNQEYYDRIDAVEYTLAHDDGVATHELSRADVVLVGVSRASKSTTCFYLAYRGIRAANVPLFSDGPIPPQLLEIDKRRIIGLTINPHRLRVIREARLRGWGMTTHDGYADRMQITRELWAVNDLITKQGWPCIDVSYKAIEEIATEVLHLLEESGVPVGGHGAELSDG